MSVSFHRLFCQHMSSQTTMSLHLQRWQRLHQTSTEEVQTNSPNVLSSSQVVHELTTFYFYHQIQNKIEPNFFLPNFLFPEKPQSHPEQSKVGAKARATSIRTTRSSKAGETHSVPSAAYVSSQQLQEKAANRRRQNAKKTGGEIFVLYLLWMFLFQLSKCL